MQDGDAHILRGFPNFGDYAADKYEDVEPEYAKKMARTGAVLAALQDAGKLTGDITVWPKTIGTAGVRALAAVETKHSTATMLKAYDLAHDKATELGKGITKDIVEATMLELAPAKVMPRLPAAERRKSPSRSPRPSTSNTAKSPTDRSITSATCRKPSATCSLTSWTATSTATMPSVRARRSRRFMSSSTNF